MFTCSRISDLGGGTSDDAAERERLARAVGREVLDQLRSVLGDLPRRAPRKTFGELASQWLATLRRVDPENERRHVDHLRPLWWLTEDDLLPVVIEAHLLKLCESGLLGPPTANKLRSTGKLIIESAQKGREWGALNPFTLASRLPEKERKYMTLNPSELWQTEPHFREDRRRMFRIALYLGPRPGELIALRAEDVDLSGATIRVHRSGARDSTKTGRERIIPILGAIAGDLLEAVRQSGGGLLFPGPSGGLQDQNKLTRCLRTAMGRAGLAETYVYRCRRKGCGFSTEYANHATDLECRNCDMILWPVPQVKKVRWYDLRHTCATLHRMAGADPLAIKMLLGHSINDITEGVYTHLGPDFLRAELSKLEKILTRPERWGSVGKITRR